MTMTNDGIARSAERHRIDEVYRRYERDRSDGWDLANPGNLAIEQERDAAVLASLQDGAGAATGAVLDLGCGYGAMLSRLEQAGFDPARLFGAEILFDRCRVVRSKQVDTRVVQVDGLTLPFRSDGFAAVVAMTVFSSILDDAVAVTVAAEIDRVLAPGGSLHVYDMAVRSPGNPNVRPVSEAGLRRLFAGYETTTRSLTVLPPLARRLGPGTDRCYGILGRIPLLRSHRLHRLTKPGTNTDTCTAGRSAEAGFGRTGVV